ncbi:synthase 3 protein 2 [Seminavis robusta]|uniref:Synthase 3 protein 2 n=1 Tax=Seminavis robusta TaxID=568900 RepID=A0A9N8DPN7_9STRA|nr:synthase 3 protein 2 [Seminavis robusta]|eukprot:Sro197_g083800.1 synthase 3 protein 2 (279) ;mRNA; r:43832-45008
MGKVFGARLIKSVPFSSVAPSVQNTPSKGLRVIGAGAGRTGTSSLQAALKIMGYKPYHMADCFVGDHAELWKHAVETGNVEKVVDMLLQEGYDAIVDEPGSYFVPQLAEHFPEAKIVLTHRANIAGWIQSVKKLALLHNQFASWPFSSLPFIQRFGSMAKDILSRRGCSVENLLRDDADGTCSDWYMKHYKETKLLFDDGRLLEYDVSEGWPPLLAHLESTNATSMISPAMPFPRTNSGDEVLFIVSLMKAIPILCAVFVGMMVHAILGLAFRFQTIG